MTAGSEAAPHALDTESGATRGRAAQGRPRQDLVHRDRRLGQARDPWVRTFACDDMRVLIVCRGPVRKELEALRSEGKVGSSLQAEVELAAEGPDHELLASLGDELKFLLLTSSARVRQGGETSVTASTSPKCERCWHYRPDVNGEGLCGRCQTNLKGAGETRRHV